MTPDDVRRAVRTPSAPASVAHHDRYLVRLPAPVAEVTRLVDELRVHPVLAATLWSRGFRDDVAARLTPALTLAAIPALDQAAARLGQALERGERVVIHGDYDADGVTATAILTLTLRALGGTVTPYLPDRLGDGYGLHPERVDDHAAAADLVVTVDCGIADLAAVAALRAAGTDVIVVDHHLPGERRPDALVVHSLDGPDTHGLSGAGLAFHLAWALHERLGLPAPLELADVAALGTIADVAPLLGPNRALVRAGLERMTSTQRPGLRALLALAKLRAPFTAKQVAFVLGPRLNAAGRLGQADVALELLLTASEHRGRVLATLLENMNTERKQLQERITAEAVALALEDDAPALVLQSDDWHPGVLGIVANQLMERFRRPTFVVGGVVGSARTPVGSSAVAALQAAHAHLVRWGGHASAAGFTLEAGRVEAFRAAVNAHVGGRPVPARRTMADALLHPRQVDADLHAALRALEPYGEGLPEPLFALPGRLGSARTMGNGGSHLQTQLDGVRAVGWGMGDHAERIARMDRGVAMATLVSNHWQERTTIELRLEGIAPADAFGLDEDAVAGGAGTAASAGVQAKARERARDATQDGVVVRALEPSDEDPLAPLGLLLRAGTPVRLDLGADGPDRVRAVAATFPSVADARSAFVLRKRGRPWPWEGVVQRRLEHALGELDLLDERGRARSGRRVDPYDAPSLRRWAVTRHALETFASLLETLQGDELWRAIEALAGVARVDESRR